MRTTVLALACFAILATGSASGTTVRYEFSGSFDFDTPVPVPESPEFPVQVNAGDAFSGFFEYDTTRNVDSNPAPELGSYEEALVRFGVSFGGTSLSFSPPTALGSFVSISNNRGLPTQFDGVSVAASGFSSSNPLPQGQNWLLNLVLRSSDLTLLNDDSLTATLPLLSSYDVRNQFLIAVVAPSTGTSVNIQGSIDSLNAVVVPAFALPPLGYILLGVAMFRWFGVRRVGQVMREST